MGGGGWGVVPGRVTDPFPELTRSEVPLPTRHDGVVIGARTPSYCNFMRIFYGVVRLSDGFFPSSENGRKTCPQDVEVKRDSGCVVRRSGRTIWLKC